MKKIQLIALLAALIAGLGLYQFLRELGKPQETPRTAVVVAAVDIPENTAITPEMIMLQPIANEALLENHIRSPESVVGMVLSSDVYAGEQIVTNRLVQVGEAGESSTLAYVVQPGMRAVTIAVNATTGLSGMIRPGNRVDLISNYAYDETIPGTTDTRTVLASRTLLQNVEVLAVGSALGRDVSPEYATVTLMTTPEDAVKLSFAEFAGAVRVVLRSSVDGDISGDTEFDLDKLLNR